MIKWKDVEGVAIRDRTAEQRRSSLRRLFAIDLFNEDGNVAEIRQMVADPLTCSSVIMERIKEIAFEGEK